MPFICFLVAVSNRMLSSLDACWLCAWVSKCGPVRECRYAFWYLQWCGSASIDCAQAALPLWWNWSRGTFGKWPFPPVLAVSDPIWLESRLWNCSCCIVEPVILMWSCHGCGDGLQVTCLFRKLIADDYQYFLLPFSVSFHNSCYHKFVHLMWDITIEEGKAVAWFRFVC